MLWPGQFLTSLTAFHFPHLQFVQMLLIKSSVTFNYATHPPQIHSLASSLSLHHNQTSHLQLQLHSIISSLPVSLLSFPHIVLAVLCTPPRPLTFDTCIITLEEPLFVCQSNASRFLRNHLFSMRFFPIYHHHQTLLLTLPFPSYILPLLCPVYCTKH